MKCPECGANFPQGASRCPECGVEFVDVAVRASHQAPEPVDDVEWIDDVVVLETTDEGQLMVARSLLEAEGIPCFTQGEESQRVIGAGPLRLRVPLDQEEEARALLAHLEPIGSSDEEPDPSR